MEQVTGGCGAQAQASANPQPRSCGGFSGGTAHSPGDKLEGRNQTMSFPHGTFSIGPLEVSNRLVMAPLHEITDQPFRKFIREIGGPGLVVSEMISSEA